MRECKHNFPHGKILGKKYRKKFPSSQTVQERFYMRSNLPERLGKDFTRVKLFPNGLGGILRA